MANNSTLIKKEGVSIIRFWGFKQNEYLQQELSLLEKAGFFYAKKGIGFVWKDLDTANRNLNPNQLFVSRTFTQGDS